VYLPNEVRTNKLTLCSELMIFIRYENNSYKGIALFLSWSCITML